MDAKVNELIMAAGHAKEKAYSKYSEFKVGAAIRTKEGKIITGCNIENVSYGLSMCAERVALYKAVSEGHSDIESLAISTSGTTPALPCGACRQVLIEFNPHMHIYLDKKDSYYILSDLMPNPFSSDQLTFTKSKDTVI
jgi:cytidine deaminase